VQNSGIKYHSSKQFETGCRQHHETIKKNKGPLIITQRGRAVAVMTGVEMYEKSEHEKELLRFLARGDREIEIGDGIGFDTVLAEADSLLAREPS
jgi:PHD/YefM family antitoxin component YafN of YafNO toxin-antitoxin module